MGNLLKMTMQIMGKSFGNLWKFGIFSMAMSSYQRATIRNGDLTGNNYQ